MDDMLETMYDAPGIGLAAIQIGVPKRVIVIDLSKGDEKITNVFVNPEIIVKSNNDAVYEEGCLSVPNQFAEINRPETCKVKFLITKAKNKLLKPKVYWQRVFNMRWITLKAYYL